MTAVALRVGAAVLGLVAATGLLTPWASAQAPSQVWDQYNYSPTTRSLAPVAVYRASAGVGSPTNVLSGRPTRFTGRDSLLTLDFGKDVGGLVTLTFGGASDASQRLGLAFSESSRYVGEDSDSSRQLGGDDGAIFADVAGAGTFTMPAAKLRGGFRYLSLFLATDGWVDLTGVSLEFTAAPGKADPHDYANHFYSNDDLLNRIWYAGAYTVQLDTIGPNQSRLKSATSGWDNSGVLGPAASYLTDGAKRDRSVWAGDLGISVPTAFATTDDMASARNSLDALYALEKTTGELPYAGPTFNEFGSDTYHLWALVGTGDYYRYTGDLAWLTGVWPKYLAAMRFITGQIDGSGLLNVPSNLWPDWGPVGRSGEVVEANTILFQALNLGVELATAAGDAADANTWGRLASGIKSAANATLWNPTVGLYRDSPGGTLYPQDGNSLAIWFGLTDTRDKDVRIAQALAGRWNALGAVTPEFPGLVGTFPGSMEVDAHLTAGDDVNALDLMRREWGYMLDSPAGTNSTFWESFNYDGSFYYNDSFVSAAHGWSTGPTSALTFSVLGLAPTSATGFDFAPHPGNLSHVEGDLTLPQGKATGSWDFADGTLTEKLTSPSGSTVRLGIPTYGSRSVTVTVNGATAWSDGHSFAANGSTDGQYIYLAGLPAGSYTVTATGIASPTTFATSVLPNQLPPGYTPCAAEGGTCTPTTADQVVAFGAGSYVYRTADGPITCDANAFRGTDPAFGLVKTCYLAPAGGPAGYTTCAQSGGTCTLTGTHEVAYGADGAFHFRLATGNTACTTAAFDSDPLPGKAKACYVSPGAPPGDWAKCADENGSCSVSGVRPMAFGADGDYWVGSTNGATDCTTGTVGVDPAYGVAKACFTWSGPPPGFARQCAAEHDSCAVTGQRTVAFGAAGSYVYRTFSGPTPCTVQAFGSDPLYGTAKNCFLTS
jgi:hypothetical protein